MSEQTAEERAAEGVNALLIKVERLEQELAGERSERRAAASALYRTEAQRDSLKAQVQEWMEGSAQLQVKLEDAERLLRARSERIHHLQKHQYGLGSRSNWEKCATEPCINDRTFLAGLTGESHE